MALIASRAPCGRVDRNGARLLRPMAHGGRAPCGRVDRNRPFFRPRDGGAAGRAPCGRVDRNGVVAALAPVGVAVAPHAGAWIETAPSSRISARRRRRAPCGRVDRNTHAGLKRQDNSVAPHAGAWIETIISTHWSGYAASRAPCGRVDRNVSTWIETPSIRSRAPCGRVDRNTAAAAATEVAAGRAPCGRVDRNSPASATDKRDPTHRQQGLRMPQSAGAKLRETGSLRRSGSADQLPMPLIIFIASNNGSASTPSARG